MRARTALMVFAALVMLVIIRLILTIITMTPSKYSAFRRTSLFGLHGVSDGGPGPLLQIDDLRAINQKQAGELKVEKGPESSSHSLHLSSSSSNGGGGGADSNSALSLFGLHGVRVMPFCNESDGSFLPPLVSSIQAPLSLLHLYSVSRFLVRLALTRRCRRAKTILRAMLSRCFRLHTR
jgi:hypothetical protein